MSVIACLECFMIPLIVVFFPLQLNKNRLNKLIKRAGSCVGQNLDNIDTILVRFLQSKATKIEKEQWHPLHSTLMLQKRISSSWTKYPSELTDMVNHSFCLASNCSTKKADFFIKEYLRPLVTYSVTLYINMFFIE